MLTDKFLELCYVNYKTRFYVLLTLAGQIQLKDMFTLRAESSLWVAGLPQCQESQENQEKLGKTKVLKSQEKMGVLEKKS